MEFTVKSGNVAAWIDEVDIYCPHLKAEINRLRALYKKAVKKEGEKLRCDEHFAVIAIHRPDLVQRRGEEFVCLRCTVTWEDGDFHIEAIKPTLIKKKKVLKEVRKKKKLKKSLKKKKRILAS